MPRMFLATLALPLALVACGGDPVESPTEEPTVAVEATAEPTPSPEATETDGAALPTDGALPSIPGIDLDGDPELTATLPQSVDGLPLQSFSMRGDQFMSAGAGTDPSFEAFLESIGADLEDVSVAVAGGGDAETFLTITAFRVIGADEDALAQQFLAASEEAGGFTGWEEATVGGKDVFTADDPSGQTDGRFYLYPSGDTIYLVTTNAPELGEAALGELP